MKKIDDIDNLFQSVAEPFEMEPNKKVWDSLESHLEKRKADLFKKKFIFYKRISILLALLLCSTVAYLLIDSNHSNGNKNELVVNSSKNDNDKNGVENLNDKKSNIEEKNNSTAQPNTFGSHPEIQSVNGNSENSSSTNTNDNSKKKSSTPNRTPKNNSSNGNSSVDNSNQSNVVIPPTPDMNFAANVNDVLKPTALSIAWHPLPNSFENAVALNENSNFPNGEINLPAPTKSNRFYVAGFYSPDYSGHRLKDNNTEDGLNGADYETKDHPLYSYSSGLTLGFQLNNHWSFQSGAIYSRSCQSIQPSTIYAEPGTNGQNQFDFNTTSGVVELANNSGSIPSVGAPMILKRNSLQSLEYVNLPFETRYQLNFSRLSIYGFGGASFNFLARQQTFVKPTNAPLQEINEIEGLKKMNYGIRLGLGAQYVLFKRASVFAEPYCRESITAINRNTPISSFPFSLGMNLGLSYHF